METIIEILNRKKQGIDCTESESAEIKGFIRECTETFPEIWDEVITEFPLEFEEVLNKC